MKSGFIQQIRTGSDPRVTRAETDAIFANLAGPKQRHDFEGVGHEPYWHRYSKELEAQIQGFLNSAKQK